MDLGWVFCFVLFFRGGGWGCYWFFFFSGRNGSPGCGAFRRGSTSRELRRHACLKASAFSGRAWLFLLPGAAGLGEGRERVAFVI